VLRVSGLRKVYGASVAVDDASFAVERGEFFGLLGPNGAGKTTTISMVVGAQDPDRGVVELDGTPVSIHSHDVKRRIGYVPQELALYEEIDARENLRFFGALYGLFGSTLTHRSAYVLEVTGLTDRARTPVATYSGGMKRRLNIAIALLHQPDLLVLDEPTVGVDPQSRNAIFDCLDNLRELGTTLLYTTHYMEEVERLCTRVAVMDHGRVIACDTMAGLNRLLPARNRVTLEVEPEGPRPPIGRADWDGDSLHVEVQDLQAELPTLLATLRDAGVRYRGIRSHRTSLEEVFLHLTGRQLRD